MQKVGDITNTATPEGEFTDGSVAGGVAPTLLLAKWFNTIQRELCNIVTGTGGTLDPDDDSQILKIIQNLQIASDSLKALSLLVGAADKVPYFTGPTTAALTDFTSVGRNVVGKATIDDVLTYLTLKSAAKRDVGVGANQIPDMSSFSGGINYFYLPNGRLLQFGTIGFAPGVNIANTNFPIQFPNACDSIQLTWTDAPTSSGSGSPGIDCAVVTGIGIGRTSFTSWMSGPGGYNLRYFAIGR